MGLIEIGAQVEERTNDVLVHVCRPIVPTGQNIEFEIQLGDHYAVYTVERVSKDCIFIRVKQTVGAVEILLPNISTAGMRLTKSSHHPLGLLFMNEPHSCMGLAIVPSTQERMLGARFPSIQQFNTHFFEMRK